MFIVVSAKQERLCYHYFVIMFLEHCNLQRSDFDPDTGVGIATGRSLFNYPLFLN